VTASTADDGLDVLAPAPRPVQFKGQAYQVGPLKLGQLPAFARAIRPLTGALGDMFTGDRPLDVGGVVDLMADHGEELLQAVAIATGIPRAELDKGDAADLLHLVPVVLSVNRDFLLGRLPPAMRAAVSLLALVGGDGQTPVRP